MRSETPHSRMSSPWVESAGGGAAMHARRRSSQLEVESIRPLLARPSSPRAIPAARRGDTFPPPLSVSRSPSPCPLDGPDGGTGGSPGRRSSRQSLAMSPARASSALRDWQEEFALPEFRPRSSSVAVPRRPALQRGHRIHERWLEPVAASAPHRYRSGPRCSPEADATRVRSFVTTARGVVSRGDSMTHWRGTPPTTPVSSVTSSGRTSPALSQSPPAPLPAPPAHIHPVVPLGSSGVGKSALIRQFLSSEYTNGYDTTARASDGALAGTDAHPALTVIVDERETRISFMEVPEPSALETLAETPEPCVGFLVIYSVVDAASFSEAAALLLRLYGCGAVYRHAVILVGNKTDLVRSRVVSTAEGRHLATAHGCKFIECSVGMNHRVDELLAGVASQLRMRADGAARPGARRRGSLGFLDKLLHRQSRSKSCQNLFA